MIAFLLPIVARAGIPARLQRLAAWLVVIVAVVALVFTVRAIIRNWLSDYRETAIEQHDKDVTIEAAGRVIAADREATANQVARDEVFEQDQEELRVIVREKGTDEHVGGATGAVLDRLRQQQAEGRR